MANEVTPYLMSAGGTLVLEDHELEGTYVGHDTKLDEIMSFVKRAYEQNPVKIVLEVGRPVRILRPVVVEDLLTANRWVPEYATKWAKEHEEFTGKIRVRDKDGNEFLQQINLEEVPDGKPVPVEEAEDATKDTETEEMG